MSEAGEYFELSGVCAEEILRMADAGRFGKVVFASSLGMEDQVITDMIWRLGLGIGIFTLDTGRLFEETYKLLAATEERYKLRVKVYFPESDAVEEMVGRDGVNLFYRSSELRKKCCRVRKVEVLQRALSGHDAWICGLRRGQSDSREGVKVAGRDEATGLVKINPLASWSLEEVQDYVRHHDVPVNALHEKGYISIGCEPCTRAVGPGENPRSGRWWWEDAGHRECGLHWADGKLSRNKN